MKKSKRILYFDVIRIMSIIGILFCHASALYIVSDIGTPNFYITAFYDCFRDFSVPLFVMLSGALLIGKNDSLIAFFKRRLSRIFIPFLFWALMTIINSFIYLKHSIDIDNAINIFLGHGGTLGGLYWFIWMIIAVYFGIFIINGILDFGNKNIEGFNKRFPGLLALLSVVYIILFQFRLLSPIFYNSILIYYFSFVCYAAIGYFTANFHFLESKINTNILTAITTILSLLLYSNYIFNYVVPTSLFENHFTYLGYFNIHILLITLCMFLMYKFLSNTSFFKRLAHGKYEDLIILLSKYSYGIYLCHYLVLFHLRRFFMIYMNLNNQNSIIWIPILVMLTLILSAMILNVLNRIPLLNKVTGID